MVRSGRDDLSWSGCDIDSTNYPEAGKSRFVRRVVGASVVEKAFVCTWVMPIEHMCTGFFRDPRYLFVSPEPLDGQFVSGSAKLKKFVGQIFR